MGILNKSVATVNHKSTELTQLTSNELEYLLNVLRVYTLTGDQVEIFYNMVVKLQKQYLELNK